MQPLVVIQANLYKAAVLMGRSNLAFLREAANRGLTDDLLLSKFCFTSNLFHLSSVMDSMQYAMFWIISNTITSLNVYPLLNETGSVFQIVPRDVQCLLPHFYICIITPQSHLQRN